MPTKPLKSILDRELSKAEAKELIELASPLLQELVNYSTNALVRCATIGNLSGREDEDVAVLALYRHMIETTDGIEVLLSQSCSTAAIPLLRSSFEALLSIEYILQNEADYIQRSLSWLVGYVHKHLEMYERLDPSTNRGRDAKSLFDKDKIASKMQFPPAADAQKPMRNLQTILAKPHIQPIEAEYDKCKKPRWYALFSGPSNLRMLADYLRRGGQYEILYRDWSTTAHAQDFLPFMARTSKGERTIGRLRHIREFKQVASHASAFVLDATRHVLSKYRPGENLATWYKREVQEPYRALGGKPRVGI